VEEKEPASGAQKRKFCGSATQKGVKGRSKALEKGSQRQTLIVEEEGERRSGGKNYQKTPQQQRSLTREHAPASVKTEITRVTLFIKKKGRVARKGGSERDGQESGSGIEKFSVKEKRGSETRRIRKKKSIKPVGRRRKIGGYSVPGGGPSA